MSRGKGGKSCTVPMQWHPFVSGSLLVGLRQLSRQICRQYRAPKKVGICLPVHLMESKDTPDTIVFEKGTFVSKECELRCKYPARPYLSRAIGDKTEFVSETQCPYKDAKIIWRGTVEGGTIRGKSTWVVKRWYRTVQDTFEFEGKLVDKSALTSGSR